MSVDMTPSLAPLAELEMLEALDFEHVPPCEAVRRECGNPADYLTGHRAPCCGYSNPDATQYVCHSCWEKRSMLPAYCTACWQIHPHGDAWHIISRVKP